MMERVDRIDEIVFQHRHIYKHRHINSQYTIRQSIKEEEHPVLQGQVTGYI